MVYRVDLKPEHVQVGYKVRLKGERADRAPRKPYPVGWQEVTDHSVLFKSLNGGLTGVIMVASDNRWIPAYLIEEAVQ